MLNSLVILFVAINAVLAALIGGHLDAWIPSGHEPQRLKQQISPEKIRLVGRSGSTVAPAAANSVAPAPAVVQAVAADAVACIELGDFSATEANRLQTAFAAFMPPDRLARRRVSDPSSFMVYIPSQGDKESADRKSGELRRLGVSDFYVMQTDGELRYAISLGIFKTRVAADAHLAELVKKGVRSGRITGRGDNPTKVAFQLRGLDKEAVAAAIKLAGTEQRDCASL